MLEKQGLVCSYLRIHRVEGSLEEFKGTQRGVEESRRVWGSVRECSGEIEWQ